MSTSFSTPITAGASSASTLFNGTSRYSADFQNVITRAVGIASLPLSLLQNEQSNFQSQQTALGALDTKFSSLQSAIQSLSTVLTSNPITASSANNGVVTALADTTALPGSYTIQVTDPGSSTVTENPGTLPTVTDASTQSISSSSAFTLTVNGNPFTINLAATNLNALAQAINAAGAGVSANVINIGPPSAADYRLVVQSTGIGGTTIQLNDGTQDLLSTLSAGTSAQYQVNGQPSTPISTDNSTVTVAPGVNVTLVGEGTTTINVTQSNGAIANALQSFVSTYNAARDQVVGNIGVAQTALSGDSILYTLSNTLNGLGTYSSSGGFVQSLADLGVSLDTSGHLSFDATTFNSVAAAHPQDLTTFLGNATSGFVQAAANILTGVEDPETGTLKVFENSVQQQINEAQSQIDDTQARITLLQQNLTQQMSAADAAIAAMEQQVSYFNQLFGVMLNSNGNSSKNGG